MSKQQLSKVDLRIVTRARNSKPQQTPDLFSVRDQYAIGNDLTFEKIFTEFDAAKTITLSRP